MTDGQVIKVCLIWDVCLLVAFLLFATIIQLGAPTIPSWVFWTAGFALGWLAIASLAGWVSMKRGRLGREGFVLGFLFGPLGVIVAGVMPQGSLDMAW